MPSFEVRYQGRFVALFSSPFAADEYVKERLDHPVEGPAFAPGELVVQPAGPVRMLVRGNLVDTFDDVAAAEDARAKLLEEHAEHLRRLGFDVVRLALHEDDVMILG